MSQIYVLNAHPRKNSLCQALAEAYTQGAQSAGAQVQLTHLHELQFDPLADPMDASRVEADLKRVQEGISAARHFVFVFPTWWTSVPALAKGFLDRTFTSGWAFQYQKGFPKGLLAGRSARIIHTCGAPGWANKWIYGEPEVRMVRDGVLKFCGFAPVKVTKFGGVMGENFQLAPKLIENCRSLGKHDAQWKREA